MKRSLLPLNALRVFDAAARHLSFTRAADELAVTPAAVGQQIRALEDVLGVILFRRTPRGLELTVEAAAGLDALRSGFGLFEDAVRSMRAGQSSKSLTIAAPRDLITHWLTPRLAAFAATDSDMRWTLLAADEPPMFSEANLDLAIVWATGPGEHDGTAIAEHRMVQVAAPTYAGAAIIDWAGSGDAMAIRCPDAGSAIAAACAAMGVATVPLCLVADMIVAGTLIQMGEAISSPSTYWLVAPTPQWRQRKVQVLVTALTAP